MANQSFPASAGFFDSVNHDRLYNAEQMIYPYHRLVANGIYPNNDGTPSDDLQVVANGGMNVLVKPGEGMFLGRWFKNPSPIIITISPNTGVNTRIDSIFVHMDVTLRQGTIDCREGGTSHITPTPVGNEAYYRLCDISVAPGATSLSNYNITDTRGSSECPWVTGLIQQVDTSALWAQFQAGYAQQYKRFDADYEAYVVAQRQAWADFISQLTEDLTVSTSMVTFRSKYTASATVTVIPINIASYDKASDVLEVFINGLLADPSMYTIADDGTEITLVNSIASGNTVEFVVFKSLLGGDADSTTSLAMRLNDKMDAEFADTGWVNLTLTNGTADSTIPPAIRMIGNRVYIRGLVKGITTAGTTIAALPVDCTPAKDHIFTSSASLSGTAGAEVEIKVGADGNVSLYSKSGTITATNFISLATSYLSQYSPNTPMVFVYKGSVTGYADLPSNAKAGDCYMVNNAYPSKGIEAGDTVLWNGSEWEIFQSIIREADLDAIINSITL